MLPLAAWTQALKKVHAQIQVLQNKKSDQDKACLQQLYDEYRKIMATGKPVPVITTQQPQIVSYEPTMSNLYLREENECVGISICKI